LCYANTGDRSLRSPLWLGAPADPPWPGLLANRLKLRVRLMVIPKHLAAMDAAVMVSSHHRSLMEPEAPFPACGASSLQSIMFVLARPVELPASGLAADYSLALTSWADACACSPPTLAGITRASNDVPAAKVAPSISPQPPISPPGGNASG